MRNPLFAVLAALLCALSASAEQRTLTLLHFNDLHAAVTPDASGRGGIAHLAGAIAKEREGCKQCILLSAGDLAQGSPVSTIFKGLPIYEMANRLKIDVATLGNHDFDYGWQQTLRMLKISKFPIVEANVSDERNRLIAPKPYRIVKRNGLRVGVIGLMTETLTNLTTPDTRGPWRTLPLAETARKYIAEIKPKSDVIVLLVHLAPDEEKELIAKVPEASVVIGGHVHGALEVREGNRVLVRLPANATELGRLDLTVDTSCKCAKSSTWKRIPVGAATPPDQNLARQVAHWERKVSEQVDVPIGEAKRTIAGADLKALIERATVETLHVDLSFMNRGGVRAPLPAGKLLARHVWNAYPFDNRVVIGRFKGKDLPAVVTEGKTIDPEREYTLAVNDFTAANQGSPSQLRSNGLEFPKTGPLQRDVLIEWIRKHKVIE